MTESTDDERATAIEAMSDAGRNFYRFGWVHAGSGNLSCRLDDNTLLVTTTGAHLGSLDDEAFIDVDFDGQPVDDGQPSGDVELHLAIVRAVDDAAAVFHVHHPEAALCSDRDHKRGFTHLHELQLIHALGVDTDGDEPEVDIPVVEARYETDEMIDAVTGAIDDDEFDAPCVNVKNHGLYVWGPDLEAARRRVEALAYLYEYAWQRPMNPKRSSSISGFDT